MTVKKEESKTGPEKKDGKNNNKGPYSDNETKVKYTFERNKEDVLKIEKVRKHLNTIFLDNRYTSDSKIYRDLPDLYINAVKTQQDLQLAIDELTAKQRQLVDLRNHFCRILEICTEDEKEIETSAEKPKCINFDSGNDECEDCTGNNITCEDYEVEGE